MSYTRFKLQIFSIIEKTSLCKNYVLSLVFRKFNAIEVASGFQPHLRHSKFLGENHY